jgi:hypothetical protein
MVLRVRGLQTLSKRMRVTYEAVTAFESKLAARVSQVDGYLDGWGVLQS